jgi:peptidoglycan hydrolase CwlO-like protein
MDKFIVISLTICLLLIGATQTSAHPIGMFKEFLIGVDENTTSKLKNEIQNTKTEIEQLKPQVQVLQKEYSHKQDLAVSKLMFYNSIGMDTYLNFIFNSNNIVDVLANEAIIQKKIGSDIQNLNDLYYQFMELKTTKDSLEEQTQLMKAIQDNLNARKQILDHYGQMSPLELADKVGQYWDIVRIYLESDLLYDNQLIFNNLSDFVTQTTPTSPYHIEETKLNEKCKVNYYIRSDHIYIHYHTGYDDLLLIGVLSKNNQHTASLNVEAGFIDGFMIPNSELAGIKAFSINLKLLSNDSKKLYVEQSNGAIVIQKAEDTGD